MNQNSGNEVMHPTTSNSDHDQFFLTVPTIRQVLTKSLLTAEASFTWAFTRLQGDYI